MRLTAKLFAAFVITMALALSVTGWLNLQREGDLFDRDLRSDSLLVGRMLAGDADASWAARGFTVERLAWDQVPAAVQPVLARGEPAAVRDESAAPDGRLDTYVARPGGALRVTGSLAAERRYIAATARRALWSSLAALALAALTSFGVGVLLIGRPTRALVDKARRVGGGDFTRPVRLAQRDELGELAREINAMTEALAAARGQVEHEAEARIAAIEQLRHAERLMTVGRLSAGIAHELGTPLNVIEGRAKMIQQGEVEGAEVTDSARIVVEQARRITAIVRQLLDFARRGDRVPHPFDLVALTGQARELLAASARKAQVTVAPPERTAALEVVADQAQILQVVTNLVVNAIQATPPGGAVTVEVRDTPGFAVIEVRDTGAGMDAATRERVFEPFFTTKDVGHGTGLGLSVAHGIMSDHGGRIEVTSAPGRGCCFSVYLPRS